MTSPSKPRRKKSPEVLDWRELARGPALRGLAEVLGTTPEVAKDRADRRQLVENHLGVATSPPTVVERPTVGESIVPKVGPLRRAGEILPSLGFSSQPATTSRSMVEGPTLVGGPTVGDGATVGDGPAVGDGPTVGASSGLISMVDDVALSRPNNSNPNTEGGKFLARDSPSVGKTPTEGPVRPDYFSGLPETGPPKPSWRDLDGLNYDARRVQRVTIAQHSMGLGEERVYQTLWHARESDGVRPETKRSKTFSLGYDRIARLVRLNEKSVRLLLPKLIRKKILEVLAPEESASRTGRTYRIFSYEEILERQRSDNLLFVVKNGRAVEFVRPTIYPAVIDAIPGVTPTVGPTGVVSRQTDPTAPRPFSPSTHLSLAQKPNGESVTVVREALARYGSVDDDAVQKIIAECRKNAADASCEEIAHFIHDKGQVVRSGKIHNPIAFLLVYVPKCFLAEGLHAFRQEQSRIRESEAARTRELEEWHSAEALKQQAILDDPESSEEDKRWARSFFGNV